MMNPRLRFLVCVSALVLGAGGVVAGCTTVGPSLKSPAAEFSQRLGVDAARIQIIDTPNAAVYANDVSGSFPTPLDVALHSYVNNRLAAAGAEGTFYITVEEARITRENIESASTLARRFNLDNRDRYTAQIRLRLSRENPVAPGAAYTETRVQRTWTIPDHLTIADREREQNAFMTQLLRDIDAAVVNGVNTTLSIGAPAGFATQPGLRVEDTPF